jgi:hypothetical protein
MKRFSVLFPLCLPFILLWSAQSVPYSGKVAINGVNFDGDARLTFSLLDQSGQTRWQNGKSREDTIRVPVTIGRYSVLLGGQGMNPLPPPQLFLDYEELYLKVTLVNGFRGEPS